MGLRRVLAGCRGSAGRLRRSWGSQVRLWWDKFAWSESARGVAARRLLEMRARRRLGLMRKESAVWGVLSCATWVENGCWMYCRYGADRRYRRGEAQGWAVPGSGVV